MGAMLIHKVAHHHRPYWQCLPVLHVAQAQQPLHASCADVSVRICTRYTVGHAQRLLVMQGSSNQEPGLSSASSSKTHTQELPSQVARPPRVRRKAAKRRRLYSFLMASEKLTHRTQGVLVGDQLTARSHNNNLQRAPLLFSSQVLNRVCLQRKSAHCTSTTASTTAHYVRTKVQGTPSAIHFNTISCRQRCVHGPNPQRACAWS